MYTLGINAVYHDPAACLVHDGQVIAAAEDERFTHVKHGKRPIPFTTYELPYHAIDYCLSEAGIQLSDVDHVAYSYDPYLFMGENRVRGHKPIMTLVPNVDPPVGDWDSVWDPLFVSSIINAPRQLADGAPHHLKSRFQDVTADGPYRWHFVEHHLCHAASAFLAGPFEESAVMTLDGRGEKATTTYGLASKGQFELLDQVNMPHSLGLLYEEVTGYLGFLRSSDEYKVMALASFGRPTFVSKFHEIVRRQSRGQYTVKAVNWEEEFGPCRSRGGETTQRHYDFAHSLQVVVEEVVTDLAKWLREETRSPNLYLAGGVALNCVMNARIRDTKLYQNIWVQPAAGDAGTALGAALWVDRQQQGKQAQPFKMDHAYWGPHYDEKQIEEFLTWSHLKYQKPDNLVELVADILAQDKVIGWFQGRMEFGPRALGSRSILASPVHAYMQDRLNEIKDREDFRPVAPVVTEEDANEWFRDAGVSPFMLFAHDVLPDKANQIPAVRHIDGTARIQTVNREQNSLYYDLLKAFERRTGVPVLVNTSFNTRGEPIVCTPRDAIECFWTSPLDALVIGPFVLEK